MAIETFMPYAVDSDMTPFFSCLTLLAESGHPMPETTFRTWIKKCGVRTEKRGRTLYLSFSDALELHRDWLDNQLRNN